MVTGGGGRGWLFLKRNDGYAEARPPFAGAAPSFLDAPFPLRRQTDADLEVIRWGLLAWEDPFAAPGPCSPFWSVAPMMEVVPAHAPAGGPGLAEVVRESGASLEGLMLSCICPETGEVRAMAFQGFEAERGACGTVKYRCPAAAFGVNCVGSKACHRAGGVKPGEYGRIVRVDLDKHDRRIFTPTPWGSPSWRRGYKRRSAMERIDGRLDNGFNFETHYIRGLAKMKTRVGLALAVMMALALGRMRAGHAGRMRSPVGAVPYPDTG